MTKKAAKPRRAVIPAGVKTLDAVYDILARDLAFPAHFGRNLDALHDVLTGDIEGPIEIVIEDWKGLAATLGEKGRSLLSTLSDAGKARRDLTVRRK